MPADMQAIITPDQAESLNQMTSRDVIPVLNRFSDDQREVIWKQYPKLMEKYQSIYLVDEVVLPVERPIDKTTQRRSLELQDPSSYFIYNPLGVASLQMSKLIGDNRLEMNGQTIITLDILINFWLKYAIDNQLFIQGSSPVDPQIYSSLDRGHQESMIFPDDQVNHIFSYDYDQIGHIIGNPIPLHKWTELISNNFALQDIDLSPESQEQIYQWAKELHQQNIKYLK